MWITLRKGSHAVLVALACTVVDIQVHRAASSTPEHCGHLHHRLSAALLLQWLRVVFRSILSVAAATVLLAVLEDCSAGCPIECTVNSTKVHVTIECAVVAVLYAISIHLLCHAIFVPAWPIPVAIRAKRATCMALYGKEGGTRLQ